MSKIGRLAIQLPDKTTLNLEGNLVTVKGEKGELAWPLPAGITLEKADQTVTLINAEPANPTTRSLHGLARARIANMVQGVTRGFERILEITGVGFKAEVHAAEIWLFVGLSHTVKLPIIPGTEIKVTKNEVTVTGIDKEKVGEMAAQIRAIKKPEPYKGKGIKYQGEVIRRKQGKAVKSSTS